MSGAPDSLAALRDQAVAGVEDLVEVIALGMRFGIAFDADDVRPPFRKVGAFDVDGFAADARRIASAHQAVAAHLDRLPEQQIRLDRGWSGVSGLRVVDAAIEHQRQATTDLSALRTLAEASTAAASGIDRLLRTWYLTVARLASPLIGDVPIAEVPVAVLTGRLALPVVVADITSRAELYFETADATVDGIDLILGHLDSATRGFDDEPDDTSAARALDVTYPGHLAMPTGHVGPPDSGEPDSVGAGAGEAGAPRDVPASLTPATSSQVGTVTEPRAGPHSSAQDAGLSSGSSSGLPGGSHPGTASQHSAPTGSAPQQPATQHSGPPHPGPSPTSPPGGDLALAGDE